MANLTKFGVPLGNTVTPVIMPKLAYRFRVTFVNLGGSGENSIKLSNQLMSVSKPNLSYDPIQVDVYNSKIFMVGKHTWETVTVTFRDDISNESVLALNKQIQLQLDHDGQSAPTSGAQYKFQMHIETLDGTNGDSFDSDSNVLETWTMAGCFISSINYGEMDYANNAIQQVSTTIQYDNASHEAGTLDGNNINTLTGHSNLPVLSTNSSATA